MELHTFPLSSCFTFLLFFFFFLFPSSSSSFYFLLSCSCNAECCVVRGKNDGGGRRNGYFYWSCIFRSIWNYFHNVSFLQEFTRGRNYTQFHISYFGIFILFFVSGRRKKNSHLVEVKNVHNGGEKNSQRVRDCLNNFKNKIEIKVGFNWEKVLTNIIGKFSR